MLNLFLIQPMHATSCYFSSLSQIQSKTIILFSLSVFALFIVYKSNSFSFFFKG